MQKTQWRRRQLVTASIAIGMAALALLAGNGFEPTHQAAAQESNSALRTWTGPGSTGNKYQFICLPGSSWDDASDDAEDRGGHLASITSSGEQQFLLDLLPTSSYYWIGLIRSTSSSCDPLECLEWVTGEAYSYSNWIGGDPNDFNGNEDFVVFNWDGFDGLWADHKIHGDGRAIGYILEIEDKEDRPSARPNVGGAFAGDGGAAERNRARANAAGAAAAAAVAPAPTASVRPPSTGDGGLLP